MALNNFIQQDFFVPNRAPKIRNTTLAKRYRLDTRAPTQYNSNQQQKSSNEVLL
jgi:hypothetical protein